MKLYGSYSDADLNDWEQFPQVSSVLTSSLFGAWLMRRDENKAKQFPTIPLTKIEQAREEIQQAQEDLDGYDPQAIWDYVSRVDEILDKLIESET